MKKTMLFATAAIAASSVIAAGVASKAEAKEKAVEKCFGVAKAGKNDCATANHACATHAEKDGAADEWVFVPKGVCARLTGGRAEEVEKTVKYEGKPEKCYGIVKAGKNDCGALNHSCASQSTVDSHPEEWVFLPNGLCDRLNTNAAADAKNKPSEG